jgi:hypothetical protein
MFAFKHKPTGLVFGINRKVMSSFFFKNDDYEFLPTIPTVDYLITRNPYDRVVSMFFSKCRQDLQIETYQTCQKVLVEALKLEGRDQLREITFSQFCLALPFVCEHEQHFQLQTRQVDFGQVRELVDIHNLPSQCPQINFSMRSNTSQHEAWQIYYSQSDRDAVVKVYKSDFDLLHYSP